MISKKFKDFGKLLALRTLLAVMAMAFNFVFVFVLKTLENNVCLSDDGYLVIHNWKVFRCNRTAFAVICVILSTAAIILSVGVFLVCILKLLSNPRVLKLIYATIPELDRDDFMELASQPGLRNLFIDEDMDHFRARLKTGMDLFGWTFDHDELQKLIEFGFM